MTRLGVVDRWLQGRYGAARTCGAEELRLARPTVAVQCGQIGWLLPAIRGGVGRGQPTYGPWSFTDADSGRAQWGSALTPGGSVLCRHVVGGNVSRETSGTRTTEGVMLRVSRRVSPGCGPNLIRFGWDHDCFT